MAKFRFRAMIISLLSLAAWGSAAAGPCDAYYSFDGNLSDGGGNGYDGEMVNNTGAPVTPQFVPGRFGRALEIIDGAAMRAMLDLHPDVCGDLTITAWIRVPVTGAKEGYLLSTGSEQGPGLSYFTNSLTMISTNRISKRDILMQGAWNFIALVYDRSNGVYRMHWGNRSEEQPVMEMRLFPTQAFWVGAYDARIPAVYNPVGLQIDELRITGSALDAAAIAALRDPATASPSLAQSPSGPVPTTGSCASSADCLSGSYCAVDGACYPNSQLPVEGSGGGGSTPGYLRESLISGAQPSALDFSSISRPDLGTVATTTQDALEGIAGRWQSITIDEAENDIGALAGASASTRIMLTVDLYGPDTNLSGHIWLMGATMLGTIDENEPLTSASRAGNTVRFASASIGEFEGELTPDGSTIIGPDIGDGNIILERIAAGSEFMPDTSAETGSVMTGQWLYTQTIQDSADDMNNFFGAMTGVHGMLLQFSGPDSILSGSLVWEVMLLGNSIRDEEPLRDIVKTGQTISFSSDSLGSVTGDISADGSQMTVSPSDSSAGGALVFVKQ